MREGKWRGGGGEKGDEEIRWKETKNQDERVTKGQNGEQGRIRERSMGRGRVKRKAVS